ncbi:MarR family winged helix-turn-helix transcriptional regulator [Nocardia sp. NPDC059239]|uniref:MarR family winged helix-turn-helix transcriptional regulator n=1 Tax=Nocardia sp. NPDC059239 TaxID=3346785 RepID=UPI003678C42C
MPDLVADWVRVSSFVAEVDAGLGTWLAEHHGLALTEYRALGHLGAMPDKELRISELARRIGLNQSSVTRLLGRLEAKHLTRRETCFEDGRGVYAVITEAGEALLDRAREPFEDQIQQILGPAREHARAADVLAAAQALDRVGARLSSSSGDG